MHACTVRIMGANQTRFVWRYLLVKLVVKVIVLTVILQVSSMAFADEHAPFEASESSVAMSDREMTVLVIED